MKVTIENKKGLSKDIKVIVDKKTMDTYLQEKYEDIRKNYTLNHLIERIKVYNEENFNYDIVNIPFKN